MKKKLSILSILLVLMLALCAFAACGNGAAKVTVLENGEILVIRADETKEDVSLEDVMNNLKKSGEIQYEMSDGMITSVNGHAANQSNGEYWFVYTSLETYKGVSYSNMIWGAYSYDGTDYASAAYGVDGLPMVEGNLYILALGTF